MEVGIEKIINEAILKAKEFTCFSYKEHFMNSQKELSDEEQKASLCILADVVSYHMNLENPKEPFQPFAIFEGKRTAALCDLDEDDFEKLLDIYNQINDSELKARIADVLWAGKKSFIHGQEAIDYYLASADRLEDWQHWTRCFERIRRALQLALMLGKNNPKVKDVNSHIENLIRKIDGNDPLYLTGRLMELLQQQKIGHCQDYIKIAEKNVASSITSGEFDKARYYLEIKSKWHQLDNDLTKSQEAIKAIAISFEDEAQKLIEDQADNSYMKIVYLLENAISTYKRIPNTQAERNRLLKDIDKYKVKMKENFKSIAHNMDVTEIVKSIDESIKGRPLIDAIIKLAFIQDITPKETLRNRVIQLQKLSPLSFLISTDIVDKNGKRIIKMPEFSLEDEAKQKIAMEAYMLKEATTNQSIFASVIVRNAVRFITEEHDIKETDLELICNDNAFIQQDRKNIFLKGIHEGFKGNYSVAIHLLIPQLENSFREFANMCGDVVTTFEDDGKEQVKPLNSVFELENFVNAYDEDLLFDLRALLTEKYGSNLRNRLAHGLLSDDDSESSMAIYVWWISLRLCCMYSKGINSYIQDNFDRLCG